MRTRAKTIADFIRSESGAAEIIAVIVLVAIAIILAIAFRAQVGDFLQNLWGSIRGREDELTSEFNFG